MKYLITRNTESDSDNIKTFSQMKRNTEKKCRFFFQTGEDEYEFRLEILSENEDEMIQVARCYAFKYEWDHIEVWKKNENDDGLYGIGISLRKDGGIELLLGNWSDWYFYDGNEELVRKQEELEFSLKAAGIEVNATI